jgi:YHS domain-containing protein
MSEGKKYPKLTGVADIPCKKCGKRFIPAAMHRYKITKYGRTYYYCSWTCYLHSDDKETKKND